MGPIFYLFYAIYRSIRKARTLAKNRRSNHDFADAWDLKVVKKPPGQFQRLNRFPFRQWGRTMTYSNIALGELDDTRVAVFDFLALVQQGDPLEYLWEDQVTRGTAVWFPQRMNLPTACVYPAHLIAQETIEILHGTDVWEFPDDDFESSFTVVSHDPETGDLLTEEVQVRLLECDDLFLQIHDGSLLVFRLEPQHRDARHQLIEDAFELYSMLCDAIEE